jgi:hypothetical protein
VQSLFKLDQSAAAQAPVYQAACRAANAKSRSAVAARRSRAGGLLEGAAYHQQALTVSGTSREILPALGYGALRNLKNGNTPQVAWGM